MKLKQISSVFFLSILVVSCEKNDSGVNLSYPSTYHKSGIQRNGDFRVFTSAGEITNAGILSRFMQTDTLNFSSMAYTIANDPGRMSDINFIDPQHARLTQNGVPLNCLLSLEGENIILSRTDTTIGSTFMDELTHHISYYIGQVKPEVYDEYLVSSTRGYYTFGYHAREKFVFRQPGGRLVAPIILFNQYFAGKNGEYQNGFVNNNLQSDFYMNLVSGDTVTLKEYHLTYENL